MSTPAKEFSSSSATVISFPQNSRPLPAERAEARATCGLPEFAFLQDGEHLPAHCAGGADYCTTYFSSSANSYISLISNYLGTPLTLPSPTGGEGINSASPLYTGWVGRV